jgi:protein gp37
MARRLKAMGQKNYVNGFNLTLHTHVLDYPLKWKKSQTIFVNSMSDLFLDQVPTEFIQKVFEVMRRAHWHTFQVLTKRSERLLELSSKLDWAPNIWMGVSVENADHTRRIDHLRDSGAHMKFLSMEPLLGATPGLNLKGIDWVIVGGESGPGARPIEESWVVDIQKQCVQAAVPFFFKQWGGVRKKQAGRELQGKTWSQMPKLKGRGAQQNIIAL